MTFHTNCNWEYTTIIKLLRCLGVKVEVFEEVGGPVLLIPLTVASLPPQMAPWILQLKETHPLQEQAPSEHAYLPSTDLTVHLMHLHLVLPDVQDSVRVRWH